MDLSEFSDAQKSFPDAELLPVSGATCDCYRVKLYGKLHFMKRLKPEFSTDPRYVVALQKEFEIGFRLDHPHLVHYVAKGNDYLLTEYVDGQTLGEFVNENPDYFKSMKNTNRFLTQLLEVVGYLHKHQVVHLDIKPSNILITRIGYEVKLTDLGFCYTDGYTDTMGRTDKYAAPEQINGSQVNATTDIYAIGKIMESLYLPSIYNKVIAKCLQPDPSDRFQSVEDLLDDLPKGKRFRFWWLIPVLFIIIAIWLYSRSPQQIDSVEQQTSIIDSISQDTINIVETQKPSGARSGKDKISPKEQTSDNNQALEAKLQADIIKAVEANLLDVFDSHKDSLRRSRDPFYSSGTYLKILNTESLKRLSSKYPHVNKEIISQEIDSLTMRYIDSFKTE
jgi:serine/threonine protein kinase